MYTINLHFIINKYLMIEKNLDIGQNFQKMY